MATSKTYDESSFRVLKGLEPVRERPGMYTRTDSPAHIIQEVIDNAADEALGGFARNIHVMLHLDGSITVTDDGRCMREASLTKSPAIPPTLFTVVCMAWASLSPMPYRTKCRWK